MEFDKVLCNLPTRMLNPCLSVQAVANFFSRPLTARRTSSWNPFRKQSGILKVFHAQSKRNRMVSKHGKINTTVRSDKIDLSR